MNFYLCFVKYFLRAFYSYRNFRIEHADEMVKLAAVESENSNNEPTPDPSSLKPTSSKRPAISPAAAKPAAAPAPSKKGLVQTMVLLNFLKFCMI